tara:strand:+ start:508 stop:672 length:165 start_codon:yes stop_codon:yes gene_type:complete
MKKVFGRNNRERLIYEKYISKSFYISFSNIYDAIKKEANDINGFKEILDSNNKK